MTNDITTTGNGAGSHTPMSGLRSALTPQSFGEVMRFAEMMAQSAFVPKDFRGKPGEIVAAVTYGSEIGLSPMQSLQSIGVVNGKPTLYGDGLLAVCQSHPQWGGMEETVSGSGESMVAKCMVKRKGEPDAVRMFSVADAKKANLWGKNVWASYPARMLQMRARGFALRDQFADALKGLISFDEARDYPTGPDRARDVTPAAPIVDPADVVEDSGYDEETGEVTYKLYDDEREYTAGDWLMEADVRIRGLTNGQLEEWVEKHKPTWRQIKGDSPDQAHMVDLLIANIRKQAEKGRAPAPDEPSMV